FSFQQFRRSKISILFLPGGNRLMSRYRHFSALLALICAMLCTFSFAQQFNPDQMKGLQWRLVGPFRGGRVLAVTGVPGDPYTFYFGGVAGGVWRTTDAGNSWIPLTDKEPFASIGAIAVAESNRAVIYVGTGESCLRGN